MPVHLAEAIRKLAIQVGVGLLAIAGIIAYIKVA